MESDLLVLCQAKQSIWEPDSTTSWIRSGKERKKLAKNEKISTTKQKWVLFALETCEGKRNAHRKKNTRYPTTT
jgi:hypothetical protein